MSTYGWGNQHRRLEAQRVKERLQPPMRSLAGGRRFPEARQIHRVRTITGLGQALHDPELLPGLGPETGTVQENDRVPGFIALDEIVDGRAWNFHPSRLVLQHIGSLLYVF